MPTNNGDTRDKTGSNPSIKLRTLEALGNAGECKRVNKQYKFPMYYTFG